MTDPTPTRPWRIVIGLVLAFHGLCACQDLLDQVALDAAQPVADALAPATDWYQRLVGFQQVWSMFTSPPTNSRGAEVSVLGADGSWRVVTPPALPEAGTVAVAYRRLGKFERNLIKASSQGDARRERLKNTLCDHGVEGEPVGGVRIVRVEKATPAPGAPAQPWTRTTQLEARCP